LFYRYLFPKTRKFVLSSLVLLIISRQFVLAAFFSSNATPNSEAINLEGKITGLKGESIPGVNVLIKGSATGTISDIEGNYSLSAPEDGTLVFSFIGFVS
jgi:hypothetical protein